jgi:hypothetical protein
MHANPHSASTQTGALRLHFAALAIAAFLGTLNPASADSLVLWNRLGSQAEILNSAHGPNLSFYGGGDELSVPANPAYAPGVFGNALTIGPGGYSVFDRVHNVVFNDVQNYLSAEHGTIEVWLKQVSTPVPFQNGIYRIFDGGFGLNSGVGLESLADGLTFSAYFGGATRTVQYDISSLNGTWIHVAGVWDRAGIDGSADTLRLYVNGGVVDSETVGDWGAVVGSRADIAGANDNNIVEKFYADNLKVYDFAMTDFSHRFDENWIVPEPATPALLAVGGVLILWRRRHSRLRP